LSGFESEDSGKRKVQGVRSDLVRCIKTLYWDSCQVHACKTAVPRQSAATQFYMTYENFLQQVNLAEQLTSSDFGVSTGLISQQYWEQSKWYFVNVERGNIADKLQPRNINVSFTNNSNVNIDVIIFTFYSDQLTIDVETGIVTR
jgi:hypothetical protein